TPGVFQANPSLLEFGLPPVKISLMPARVDDEKHLAFLHHLPRLESDCLDVTGNAWTHVNRFHRFGPAGEFVPFDNFLPFSRRDRNRRWRRVLLHAARTAAGGQGDYGAKRKP